MAGTTKGGQKARDRNIEKYGADFYAKIGAKGGKMGHTGGFFANRDLARKAGALGGRVSRRTKKIVEEPVVIAPVVSIANDDADNDNLDQAA